MIHSKRNMIPSRLSLVFVAFSLYTATLLCYAQIYVDEPPHLVEHIQGSTAAFGTPSYGEYILGRFVYGQSNDVEHPHCADDYNEVPDATPIPDTTERIMMVRRGGCHFAKKVLVAEEKGAKAVIVVDNDPLRSRTDIRMIIMAEDEGLKKKINIPSILISYEQGERLIQAILDGTEIYGRLEWDIPNAETVVIDHWNSPALAQSVKFLQLFAPVARRFKTKLDFRPHFWVFPLVRDYKTMCSDATAKFCAISTEWGDDTTGKTVVEESVRQKCLWEKTSKHTNGTLLFPRAYWDYLEQFPKSCPATRDVHNASKVIGEDCSFNLMYRVDAPVPAVKQCYANQFDDILTDEKYTVAWSPAATMINNWRYSGPLQPEAMTAAICTGFFEEPEECRKSAEAYMSAESSSGVPWWVYILSVLAVILAMLAAVVCYRVYIYKKLRNELRYEVFEEVKNRTQGKKRSASRGDKGSNATTDKSLTTEDFIEDNGGVKPFDGVYNHGLA